MGDMMGEKKTHFQEEEKKLLTTTKPKPNEGDTDNELNRLENNRDDVAYASNRAAYEICQCYHIQIPKNTKNLEFPIMDLFICTVD